ERLDVQVAVACGRRSDPHGAVRGPDVRGVGIGVRIDGHGGDPELAAGAHPAHGNLAPTGDEQALDGTRGHYAFTQPGLRLSRKARRPPWPSGDTRCTAMACAVSSATASGCSPHTIGMRALAAAT